MHQEVVTSASEAHLGGRDLTCAIYAFIECLLVDKNIDNFEISHMKGLSFADVLTAFGGER